jgi:hypothetical protein
VEGIRLGVTILQLRIVHRPLQHWVFWTKAQYNLFECCSQIAARQLSGLNDVSHCKFSWWCNFGTP